VVTAEAKVAFQRALARDVSEPKARYYLGLAAKQDGNAAAAVAIWRSLLADAPPGAPWSGFVREALTRVGEAPAVDIGAAASVASGPSAADIAAASSMTDEQRQNMIRGMVARLAERLHNDGRDVEGWLRLVRAYVVLGDRDKAKSAADDAKRALGERPDDIKRIDDLLKGLGLAG